MRRLRQQRYPERVRAEQAASKRRQRLDPVKREKFYATSRRWYRVKHYGTDIGDNPLKYHKDRFRHARALGFRSGLEVAFCKKLDELGVKYEYEPIRIPYVPKRTRYYKPDYVLPNGIIIEAKGAFQTEDRTKHLNVKEEHPDLDIRFAFSNPNNRIGKKSHTTYAMWCDSKGFKYCKATEMPLSWLKEPVNAKSLAVINTLRETDKQRKKKK